MIGRSKLSGTDLEFYPLSNLTPAVSGLPMTVKVLLEGLVRLAEAGTAKEEDVKALGAWPSPPSKDAELPFLPARVLMQDFTGVPAVVDLAAMRSAMKRAGQDAGQVGPLGAGRFVRLPRLIHPQHREGDRAQPRALRPSEVGAAGVQQLLTGAAG